MTWRTYDRLLAAALKEARAGCGVILDATFARREQRAALMARLAWHHVAYRFIEAQAGDAAVKRRLKAREAKADEVSDARLEDFSALTGWYEPPKELPACSCVVVRADTAPESTAARALQALVEAQLCISGRNRTARSHA